MFPMMFFPGMMVPNLPKLRISHDEPPTIYSLLNSYVNFGKDEQTKIKDLAKTGRGMFFDFEYPLPDGMSSEWFETMVLNHYMMRRIGYETVTAFKLALNVKLNEIMPMYVKLFEAIENWNIFADGEVIERTKTDSRTASNNGTTNGNSSASNTSTSDRRYSNTPENRLNEVRSGEYISDYNYDQDSANSTGTTSSSSTNSSAEGGIENERISRTPGDKMALYTQFLQNRQNIITMVFKDLDVLFYQII